MDLSQFDTRDKAQEGVWIDLVIDGETVYGDDNEPVKFKIKGAADDEVRALVMKATRAPASTPAEALESDMKLARAAILDWSDNFSVSGEKVPYSRQNIVTVMGNPKVRNSIVTRIFDDKVFMNGS